MSDYNFLESLNTAKAETLTKRAELDDAIQKIDLHISEIEGAIRLYQKMKPFVAPPPSALIQNSPTTKGLSSTKNADIIFDIYEKHKSGLRAAVVLQTLREKHGLDMSNAAILVYQKELETQGFIKKIGWGVYAPVD